MLGEDQEINLIDLDSDISYVSSDENSAIDEIRVPHRRASEITPRTSSPLPTSELAIRVQTLRQPESSSHTDTDPVNQSENHVTEQLTPSRSISRTTDRESEKMAEEMMRTSLRQAEIDELMTALDAIGEIGKPSR